MGYYSDVKVICGNKAYEELKQVWEKVHLTPNRVTSDGKSSWLIEWDYVKWYPNFEDVNAIEKTVNRIAYDESDGIYFVRVGEDINDVEYFGNDKGYDLTDYEFYPTVIIEVPDRFKNL